MINTNKIKGRMAELCLNNQRIAPDMGVCSATVGKYITGKAEISLEQAEQLAEILKISKPEFCDYFFTQQLQNATAHPTSA